MWLQRMTITYHWKGDFDNRALEALHAEGFEHKPADYDWKAQLRNHSLGWVCARDGDELVGFVNVAWDGGAHAFILDTLVAKERRRQAIATRLVAIAMDETRTAGCEWLHADFDEHLKSFYFEACGFTPVDAGVIRLR